MPKCRPFHARAHASAHASASAYARVCASSRLQLALAALLLAGCLLDESAPGPSVQGYFGNRLDGLPLIDQLDSSALAFAMMRERSGNSYTYRIRHGGFLASETGHSDITVKAGVPVRRETILSPRNPQGTPATRTVEDSAQLAGLDAVEAPATLDSMYARCRSLLTQDPAKGEAGFGYDGNYILQYCGYRADGIQDWMMDISIQMRNWAWK